MKWFDDLVLSHSFIPFPSLPPWLLYLVLENLDLRLRSSLTVSQKMLDVVELSLLMPVYPPVMRLFSLLCSGHFSFSLFHHRYAHLCCKFYISLLDP